MDASKTGDVWQPDMTDVHTHILPLYSLQLSLYDTYERWLANNYGTKSWHIYIVRTAKLNRVERIIGIHPGAQILFRARGKMRLAKSTAMDQEAQEKNQRARGYSRAVLALAR